jgi:hypothetical protein
MNTEHVESPAERALIDFRSEMKALLIARPGLDGLERRVQELLNARGREVMADLMKAADTVAPEVEIDGSLWGNRRDGKGTYQTIFGPIELERSVYQRAGRGRVAVPMDLRLGIVEGGYTPRMARIMSHATAMMTDEEASLFLHEVGTAQVGTSTIHRVPRAMSARYERSRPILERAVRERDEIPEATASIQVALDGVMVPQDGEHAKPRGRATEEPDPPRHEQRYGVVCDPGPAENDGHQGRAWHEGSVGTLAFFDVVGRRLKTTYLARMPESGKATLARMLEDEAQAVIAERPDVNIAFASDGAAPQWTVLEAIAGRLPSQHSGHTMFLVDAFHVFEYVQKAANAVEGQDEPEAKILAASWRETLKEKEGGALTVLRSMRAHLATVNSGKRREELEDAIGYIDRQNEAGRMNYTEATRRHYPIGTGVTEAAAKTVVGTRMKRAGARFSQHGGQTVMLFRTAILSQRFEALHLELGATYTKAVKIAA